MTPEHILRDKLRKIEACLPVRQQPVKRLPRARLERNGPPAD